MPPVIIFPIGPPDGCRRNRWAARVVSVSPFSRSCDCSANALWPNKGIRLGLNKGREDHWHIRSESSRPDFTLFRDAIFVLVS